MSPIPKAPRGRGKSMGWYTCPSVLFIVTAIYRGVSRGGRGAWGAPRVESRGSISRVGVLLLSIRSHSPVYKRNRAESCKFEVVSYGAVKFRVEHFGKREDVDPRVLQG